MNTYQNNATDCIKWIDNNKALFSNIIAGMGISNEKWNNLESIERIQLSIAIYQIFLENQDALNQI